MRCADCALGFPSGVPVLIVEKAANSFAAFLWRVVFHGPMVAASAG